MWTPKWKIETDRLEQICRDQLDVIRKLEVDVFSLKDKYEGLVAEFACGVGAEFNSLSQRVQSMAEDAQALRTYIESHKIVEMSEDYRSLDRRIDRLEELTAKKKKRKK